MTTRDGEVPHRDWLWQRSFVLLTLAATLLAFGLRIHRLDGQGLWSDESISLTRASAPLTEMLQEMPPEHAPLYFVVLNRWLALAGTTDFSLRFPSAWFSVLAVPLLAVLARAMFRPVVGVLAAILLAVNPLHVWYGQDARMYSMSVALGLLTLWALLHALRTNRSVAWAAYAFAAALGLYTHFYFGLIILISAVFGVGVLAVRWRREERSELAESPEGMGGGERRSQGRLDSARRAVTLFRPFLLAEAAIIVLLLPWLPRALRVLDFPGWQTTEPVSIPTRFATRFFLGSSVPLDSGWRVAAVFVALLLVGLGVAFSRFRSRRPDSVWLLFCWLGVPLGVAALMAWRRPDFHERYYIVATPALYISLALAIDAVRRRGTALAAVVLLAFVFAASGWSLKNHYTNLTYAKPDYRDFTQHVIEAGQADDALVLLGPGFRLTERYGAGALPQIYNLRSTKLRDRPRDEIEALLAEIADEHGQVWLVLQGVYAENPGFVKEWLDGHGYRLEGGWRTGLLLYRYAFDDNKLSMSPAEAVTGPEGVTVVHAVSPARVAPGGLVHAVTEWRFPSSTTLPPDTHISLRLLDESGEIAAVHDTDASVVPAPSSTEASGALVQSRIGLRVPAEALPERYLVAAVLYAVSDPVPLAEAVLGSVVVIEEQPPQR